MFVDLEKAKDSLKNDASALSPFVYRKVSLTHLEIEDQIMLKFRRANFSDHDYFREKYGDRLIEKATEDILRIVNIIYHFLTKESRQGLLKIKFTDLTDEGKEIVVKYPLDEVFQKILVSSVNGQQVLFNLFLEIFGYTKEQIEQIQNAGKETKKKAELEPINDKKR